MDTLDWHSIIEDSRERSMFKALDNPSWEWRTVRALSRESGLTSDEVRTVIARYRQLIRQSGVPSEDGEDLYTLQSRYYERKSPLQKGWDFLSSSST